MKITKEEFWCPKGHLSENQYAYIKQLVTELKPRYCLETGFATGRSACSVLSSYDQIETFFSIDINYDYWPSSREYLNKFKTLNNFKYFEGSSRAVLNDYFFNKEFPNGIDWFTIDGDHSYEGCLYDLESSLPFMNTNGIMIIDDYMSGPPEGCDIPEVTNACDDFYEKNQNKLIKSQWNEKGKGFCIFKIK